MKNKSLILILLFSILLNIGIVSAQDNPPVPFKNGSICYENVVKVNDNMTKLDLFKKAKQWTAKYFPATFMYSPIQLEDAENGFLMIHIKLDGSIYAKKTTLVCPYENITCSAKIQVKDGRYMYTFTNFEAIQICGPDHNNTRIKVCLDIFFSPDGKYDKNAKILLVSIDYNMKNIIKNLDNTLKENVLDDF